MGECMLDSYDEDDFQSSEGFDADWSTFSSADWAEPQHDDNRSDWSEFQDNTRKEEELSSIPVVETGTSELPEKTENENQANVQFVFHDCFHDGEAEKETLKMEIPTLFQLLHSKTDLPSQPVGISSEAANFWCHLQSDVLRLSGIRPKLHCREKLLKTLQLRQPDTDTSSQSSILSELKLEELEDLPVALIQTKLLPPSNCRNAPGFFYQISQQWLGQHRWTPKNPLQ